ncbi:unnamed protein product [Lepeophtheirus salmonis]|uniref:(salmon louse) hypothetical protein n=1 Tax=Lepeophtheirus salmonis TaxID=72036 RepID=A0A7R8HD66_LEPSM|nr:unnamed protein product [Lepeophtheirus salmonis]CAF3017169.1 unnamed protein product [Lepeophtheirus salmonis]
MALTPVPLILFFLTPFVSSAKDNFNCTSMTPLNKELDLQLKSNNYHHFKIKFFLKARYLDKDFKEPIGEWIKDSPSVDKEDLKLLNCGKKNASGIVGKSDEGFSSVELKWKPPSSLDADDKEVEFVGTFVEGKNYWKDIKSEAMTLESKKDEKEDGDEDKRITTTFNELGNESTTQEVEEERTTYSSLNFAANHTGTTETNKTTTESAKTTTESSTTKNHKYGKNNGPHKLSVISPKLPSSSSVQLSFAASTLLPCIIFYIIIN